MHEIAATAEQQVLDHGVLSSFDEKSGLPHLALWPVLPLDRHIYVGTTGRGVAILDRSESVTPTPVIDLESPLIEHNAVLLRWKALAYWGMGLRRATDTERAEATRVSVIMCS